MAEFFFPDKNQIEENFSEAARYLGYRRSSVPDSVVTELLEESIKEMHEVISPAAVYEDFPLVIKKNAEDEKPVFCFGDVEIASSSLYDNLKDCSHVTIFAATVGPKVDALIRKYQLIAPAKASVMQACGAMYIEQVVNLLNDSIKARKDKDGFTCRPRYSPGYGDVPLQVQKHFFRLLPCQRIGLTLMDSLIMAPEKSVTAFVGSYKRA